MKSKPVLAPDEVDAAYRNVRLLTAEEVVALRAQKLFTVGDVARILHMSKAACYRLIMAEVLPSVKIGKSRRVTMTSIERFISHLEEQGQISSMRN